MISNLELAEKESWDSILREGYLAEKEIQVLYVNAKWRCQVIPSLLVGIDRDQWIKPRIFLAEALFWVRDYFECKVVLDEILNILPDDSALKSIIDHVSTIINTEALEDDNFHEQADRGASVSLSRFSTPTLDWIIPPIDSSDITSIQQRWLHFQTKEETAGDQFLRMACIATNELESVFKLEGQSGPRLIRHGFLETSIQTISNLSQQKKKGTIIRILNDTLRGLLFLSSYVDGSRDFNSDYIRHIHQIVMSAHQYTEEEDEDHTVIRKVRIGAFRKVACVSEHLHSSRVTQYCHHKDIEEEMMRYCSQASTLLADNSLDPFAVSAWLQWAFLRIHPFEDGNGRVSRIISSLPFSKLHLPPIAVTCEFKREYFECLHSSDNGCGIELLSHFLRCSLIRSLDAVGHLRDVTTLACQRKKKIYPVSHMSRSPKLLIASTSLVSL